ncbi:MAG: NADH-quinone oxidoreductase subunit N [Candidatus Neomarinimicrobiota bacterium]
MITWNDIGSTFPELVLVAAALVILLLEVMREPPRTKLVWVAVAGIVVALALELGFPVTGQYYSGMIAVGNFSRFLNVIYLVLGGCALMVAVPYLRKTLEERGEYYALVLFATVGMMFMTKAHDLTIVFLGLELLSISLYVLVGFYRNRVSSNEAGLKYLLLGAFSTGFFLFGIALIYGSTGSTDYDVISRAVTADTQLSPALTLAGFGLLLVGFGFKVALAPFHMYAPDVYEGAPTSITAFLSTGPKVAGFAALLKLIVVVFAITTRHWWGVLWVLAALTMTVGNITAIRQDNIKRMLAYSSVAHAGYLAIGLLVGSLESAFGMIYYLAAYGITTMAAFGMVAVVEQEDETALEVSSYRGLANRSPVLAAVFALALLSLAGFPPTAGFFGKFFIFSAAVNEGYIWLVVLAVLNSLVSVYYYLRPVVAMYMHPAEDETPVALPTIMTPVTILLVLVVLGLGIFPMLLVTNSAVAVDSLF